jgi:hypothetical protein
VTEEMSGGLRHHSDEATGPESCGWIKRHPKKYRYYLEQTSASALRGSYAPGLQKQSSMDLDSADVVRDVEKLQFPPKQQEFGGYKMPRRLRTSLVEHPSAILFLLISRVGVFQHPQMR